MSSKKSGPPLHIEPKGSYQLALLLLLIHGTGVALIAALPIPSWIIAVLCSGLIVSLIHTFYTYVMGHGRGAVRVLHWSEEGEWTLVTGEGETFEGQLLPGSFVHPRLVILNFEVPDRRRRVVVLFPDSLDSATFRRLVARLRMEE